jgi:hypothetical protein
VGVWGFEGAESEGRSSVAFRGLSLGLIHAWVASMNSARGLPPAEVPKIMLIARSAVTEESISCFSEEMVFEDDGSHVVALTRTSALRPLGPSPSRRLKHWRCTWRLFDHCTVLYNTVVGGQPH